MLKGFHFCIKHPVHLLHYLPFSKFYSFSAISSHPQTVRQRENLFILLFNTKQSVGDQRSGNRRTNVKTLLKTQQTIKKKTASEDFTGVHLIPRVCRGRCRGKSSYKHFTVHTDLHWVGTLCVSLPGKPTSGLSSILYSRQSGTWSQHHTCTACVQGLWKTRCSAELQETNLRQRAVSFTVLMDHSDAVYFRTLNLERRLQCTQSRAPNCGQNTELGCRLIWHFTLHNVLLFSPESCAGPLMSRPGEAATHPAAGQSLGDQVGRAAHVSLCPLIL